ncbi:unnamed protein product [Trifolium pratense]|uniref:Uncharacterized protein n=1 Tax=Trifolium pratense TaxID=57577 RepID=A0ACB0JT49_TRIPR|nr:unnamed protein product [Trifolium pratense]
MGKKRALLVALKSNNPNMIDSHISCHRFEECITKHCGFLPQDICKIIDDKDSKPHEVSRDAILRQLYFFDGMTKSGDVLLFYYAGHGQLEKGYPALLMNDQSTITGQHLQPVVVNLNARKAVFTVIADCCHSGGLLRYAYEQIGNSVVDRGEMQRQGILLSACQQLQVSLGTVESGLIFTELLIQFIAEANGIITYWDLITKVKLALCKIGAIQIPGLYCTDEEAKAQIFEHF